MFQRLKNRRKRDPAVVSDDSLEQRTFVPPNESQRQQQKELPTSPTSSVPSKQKKRRNRRPNSMATSESTVTETSPSFNEDQSPVSALTSATETSPSAKSDSSTSSPREEQKPKSTYSRAVVQGGGRRVVSKKQVEEESSESEQDESAGRREGPHGQQRPSTSTSNHSTSVMRKKPLRKQEQQKETKKHVQMDRKYLKPSVAGTGGIVPALNFAAAVKRGTNSALSSPGGSDEPHSARTETTTASSELEERSRRVVKGPPPVRRGPSSGESSSLQSPATATTTTTNTESSFVSTDTEEDDLREEKPEQDPSSSLLEDIKQTINEWRLTEDEKALQEAILPETQPLAPPMQHPSQQVSRQPQGYWQQPQPWRSPPNGNGYPMGAMQSGMPYSMGGQGGPMGYPLSPYGGHSMPNAMSSSSGSNGDDLTPFDSVSNAGLQMMGNYPPPGATVMTPHGPMLMMMPGGGVPSYPYDNHAASGLTSNQLAQHQQQHFGSTQPGPSVNNRRRSSGNKPIPKWMLKEQKKIGGQGTLMAKVIKGRDIQVQQGEDLMNTIHQDQLNRIPPGKRATMMQQYGGYDPEDIPLQHQHMMMMQHQQAMAYGMMPSQGMYGQPMPIGMMGGLPLQQNGMYPGGRVTMPEGDDDDHVPIMQSVSRPQTMTRY